jgi:hypothetical protein
MFLWLCGLTSPAAYTDYVLKVMFSPDFTDAEYIVFLCGLVWVFKETTLLSADELGELAHRRENLENEIAKCRTNVETALLMLPFRLPFNIDYVTALGFAV